MQDNLEIEMRKASDELEQVTQQQKSLEMRAEFLRGLLAGLEKVQKPATSAGKGNASGRSAAKELLSAPSVNVGNAIRQAMRALRQFTKSDAINWVRSTYPTLEFSDRSWGRPLREMIDKGEVVQLKKNVGNKSEAVYGIKEKISAG
jgi:hypothetical protein